MFLITTWFTENSGSFPHLEIPLSELWHKAGREQGGTGYVKDAFRCYSCPPFTPLFPIVFQFLFLFCLINAYSQAPVLKGRWARFNRGCFYFPPQDHTCGEGASSIQTAMVEQQVGGVGARDQSFCLFLLVARTRRLELARSFSLLF